MRSRLITIPLSMLAVGFAACGTNPVNDSQSPYTVDPSIDLAVHPVDPTTAPIPEPIDAEPVDAERQAWCLPTAAPYDTTNIPALPETFTPSNFCATESLAPLGDAGASTEWAYDPTMQILVVSSPTVSSISTQVFTLDDAGNATQVHAYGDDGFRPANYVEAWYALNDDGQMVHNVSLSMPFQGAEEHTWRVIERDQTWEDGVLTRFTEHDGQSGALIRDTAWQYDSSGRLALATATDRSNLDVTRIDEAAWTYHDGGQPASVVRTINGVVIVQETWTFDGAELVSRTHYGISNSELQAQVAGVSMTGQFAPLLDDYRQLGGETFSDDPWLASVPLASNSRDCHFLPLGAGHGYPQAEPEHRLGVEVSERPIGIGTAYSTGNGLYHHHFGDLAWYGHHGLGSGWLGLDGIAGPGIGVFDTEVFYESGVMVRETGDVTRAAESFIYARERTLDSGFVTSDRATIESDDQTLERTMLFTRDDDGNILTRSLLNDDLTVIETQHTAYDSSGHVIAHSVEPGSMDAADVAAEPDPSGEIFAGPGRYTTESVAWSWTYDGDRVVERAGPPGVQTVQYDGHGNPVASEGSFLAFPATQGFSTWTYNDAGQETESCWTYDGDFNRCTRTVYDAAARVAWRESNSTDGDYNVTSAYDYYCSE